MIRTILILFLCFFPVEAQTIREQTQQNLMAMNNISATQIVDGSRYRVAMYGGQQVFQPRLPTPYVGIRLGAEWFGLLQASQTWTLVPAGDHFTYSSGCRWSETDHHVFRSDVEWEGWVPCEGEVYLEGNNIVRITQRLRPNRMARLVTFDMNYSWVQLKTKHLLPVRMTMSAVFKNGDTKAVNVTWSDYKEYGSELVVTELAEKIPQ
jgi:hypothetical protein